MSYTGISSYFTFTPHEIMSGFGFNPQPEPPRMRMARSYGRSFARGYMGFGAVADTFDPDAIMANIAKSDKCYGPGGKGAADPGAGACNYAGQQVGKEMQVALNELGYGPIAVDGTLSWRGPYQQYLADNGLTMGPGFGITRQALVLMKQQLVAGITPGPGEKVGYEKVGGEYVPTDKGGIGGKLSRSSLALGLIAVAAVGAIVIVARKKKKKGQKAQPAQKAT